MKYNATTVAIQPIQNLVMSKLENTTKTSDYGKNVNLGYYFQHHNMEEIERTCRNQAISGYVYSDSLNRALKTNTSSVKKKKVTSSDSDVHHRPGTAMTDRFGHTLSYDGGMVATVVSRNGGLPSVEVTGMPKRGFPFKLYHQIYDIYFAHREVNIYRERLYFCLNAFSHL